ncbi:MAG TPA: hypothetical protein PK425_01670 [Syntrophales bacterium]|nr:hypothetical protein [Syntrophales bacterium]HPX55220.1 hypothetical protein [Syntrophales bacterium]HQA82449.1 hypothetical protein [Syntrophales bacterium]
MMYKVCVRTLTMILFCLFFAAMGSAASLDTQGESCGTMSCSVKSAVLKSVTPEKTVYEFQGTCGYWSSDKVACPPATQVTATGEWFKNSKIAHEKIYKPIANSSSVILKSETSSSCPENPWLKAGVACNVVSGNTEPGVSYPRSAAVLSSAQRQYLASAQPPDSQILPTPQAPVIVLPTLNQKFVVIPANVKIQVKHNPNYGVNLEFQWKPFPKPNTPPGFYVTKKLTPANLKTTYGVTTAEVKIDTKGLWRMRSQSIFPGAPWSDWTAFTVDALTLSPALKKQINSVKPLN